MRIADSDDDVSCPTSVKSNIELGIHHKIDDTMDPGGYEAITKGTFHDD